jgi:hypothetical protein
MDRKRIVRLALIAIVPVLLLITLLCGPSFVTIESSKGANIMMAETKDGIFKKIGTTKVTRFFLRQPPRLYVSAELSGKQTIASIPPKRLSHQSVRLELSKTTTAKKLTDGAVMDANFSGNQGRGIVYGQNTLVGFYTDSSAPDTNPEFVGMPYVRKVIWNSFDTFMYLSEEGVGQFINGVDKSDSEVGTTITGKVNIDSNNTTEQGTPIIVDISKTDGHPLVLLSHGNIFTSTDMGTHMRAVVSFEPTNREMNIFTTQDSIFKVTYPELIDADIKGNNEKPKILLEEYSYTGEKLNNTYLDDDSNVVSIVRQGTTTWVLTQAGLHVVDGKTVRKSDIYFANPADMVVYKDQVLVLAKDGLWRVGSGGLFQLV